MIVRFSSLAAMAVVVALMSVMGWASLADPEIATAKPGRWCGSVSSDWLCPQVGRVRLAGHRTKGPRPRHLSIGEGVWVGAGSEARVTFAQQAFCALGGVAKSTEIITRVEGSLFQQLSGATSCTSIRNATLGFGFFCDAAQECPAKIWADGSILAEWVPPGTASASAYASSVPEIVVPEVPSPVVPEIVVPVIPSPATEPRRELVSVVCGGAWRIAVDTETSSAESSGFASGRNRIVIRIVEASDSSLSVATTTTGGSCPRLSG
jgi:hypothetical protein